MAKTKAPAPVLPTISPYQKWEPVTVRRNELKNAPYNPRTIGDKARAKLKKNIGKNGIIEPPVWNRRTGNIVGGHQRLKALDALHKSDDYSLTVAAVELDDKEEREQNIFLNNGEAQGEWDLDKMESMFADGINVDATGFDPASVIRLFGAMPGQENRSAEDLEAVAGAVDAAKKVRADLSKKSGDTYSDDAHYYLVMVGGNDAQRDAVTTALKLEENRYQDLRIIGRLLGYVRHLGGTRERAQEWVAGLFDESCDAIMMDPDSASGESKVGNEVGNLE